MVENRRPVPAWSGIRRRLLAVSAAVSALACLILLLLMVYGSQEPSEWSWVTHTPKHWSSDDEVSGWELSTDGDGLHLLHLTTDAGGGMEDVVGGGLQWPELPPSQCNIGLTEYLPSQWDRWHVQLWRGAYRWAGHGREFVVELPLWVLPIAFAVLPTERGCRLIGAVRRRQRQLSRRCGLCGYDLRASAGRCPECGQMTNYR